MTIPYKQQAYGAANSGVSVPAFVFEDRDPTTNDTAPNYQLYQGWINTTTKGVWYLEAFLASNGVITSQWRAVAPIVTSPSDPTSADYQYPLGQTWVNTSTIDYWVLLDVSGTTATWIHLSEGGSPIESIAVDTSSAPGTNPVLPNASNEITLTGAQVAAGTIGNNVVRSASLAANTATIQVQRANSSSVTDLSKNGVAHFSASQFGVDANAFVTILGAGPAATSFNVDAHTSPGTDPVLANATGEVTITGGQVASGTIGANVIRTDSLAANTYTIEIQRTAAVASTDSTKNGVCHFNSNQFSVDSNGFVSTVAGGDISSVVIQTFTSNGTYTPTTGMVYCQVQCYGGGGGGGGSGSGSGTGGGGGSGEYALGIFNAATIGASQTVTIGSGGAGGIGANTGSTGGTTSLGALITALGGAGGLSTGDPNLGGLGGTGGTGGSFRSPGNPGGTGFSASGLGDVAGYGANSILGGGGRSIIVADNNGNPGLGKSSGGSGSISAAALDFTGGAGADGLIIITEYVG